MLNYKIQIRSLFLLIGLCFSVNALANCPIAEQKAREKGLQEAILPYYQCAFTQNDDDTQLYLAGLYETGKGSIAKNIPKALLFYHLSMENGNATAMVRLSQLLTQLDSDPNSRAILASYLEKIKEVAATQTTPGFSGKLLHPYALLVLAAEKPEAKWFYNTHVKTDTKAAQLLKNYTIDPALQKSVIREATAWKQRKMVALAYSVLSVDEYLQFMNALYPENNVPDQYARSRAVSLLKDRIESQKSK